MGTIQQASRHESHRERYVQIAGILARHGFGYVLGITGLERFVPGGRSLVRHPARPAAYTNPEHVRIALEELGAASVKLGQILSTRSDLLPPEYLAELAKLQDSAAPVPFAAIEEAFVQELGQPPAALFATFEQVPLAAASIGQVHAATLHDGTEVVVKVRRPGVEEQVAQDLDILQTLAATAGRRWELADQYDLVGLAQEFAQSLRAELDYIREGRNAERFANNFAGDPSVHVPRIFWETTTARVLTMERIRGTKIDDRPALEASGIDLQALARRAVEINLKMVFEDGFFHADPHPGNFFIEPGGRIGLIDFGMVGTVDEPTQQKLVALLVALTGQDSDRLVDACLDLGVAHARIDRQALRQDLEHLLVRTHDQPLSEIDLNQMMEEMLGIVRRHRLQLPANLVLLLKTVVMSEGMGVQLDPDFNLTTVLVPYAQRLVLRQYAPLLSLGRLGQASLDWAQLGMELPQQLRRLGRELERGGLEVGLRPEGFDPILSRLERLTNRLVLGIIGSAFIIGLAMLLVVYRPPWWDQWSGAFFGVGFLIVLALAFYLAWSIVRSK